MAEASKSQEAAPIREVDLHDSSPELGLGLTVGRIMAITIAGLVLSSRPSLASSLTRVRHVLTETSVTMLTVLRSSNSNKSSSSLTTWNSITREAL